MGRSYNRGTYRKAVNAAFRTADLETLTMLIFGSIYIGMVPPFNHSGPPSGSLDIEVFEPDSVYYHGSSHSEIDQPYSVRGLVA